MKSLAAEMLHEFFGVLFVRKAEHLPPFALVSHRMAAAAQR